jgi:ribosomal protein S18 acetylase RimI-like enzyme
MGPLWLILMVPPAWMKFFSTDRFLQRLLRESCVVWTSNPERTLLYSTDPLAVPDTRQNTRKRISTLQLREFQPDDTAAVVDLWQRCGLVRAWNDPAKDILRKLGTQPELFLVGCLDSNLIATVMAGYDGHRGWVNYLAVTPEYQRKGYGRQLMQAVESALHARGCPKLNLQIRSGNDAVQAFYRRLGYAEDDVISMGKRLIPD